MAFLVLALGAFLSICGALSILYGYGIVEVERGWTAVIAGVTALTGGIVTLALGLILRTAQTLLATLRQRPSIVDIPVVDVPVVDVPVVDMDAVRVVPPDPAIADPHEPRLPAAPVAPSATLMTPELESSMMAAIMSTQDLLSTQDQDLGHPYREPQKDATGPVANGESARPPERGEMRPVHINDLLETQRDPGHDGRAETPPAREPARDTATGTPDAKPRFKVNFRRPADATPSPAERRPPDPAPSVEAKPDAEAEPDAPAMDDWLDRELSKLDREVPPSPIRTRIPAPEEAARTVPPDHAHAMAHADNGTMTAEAAPHREPDPTPQPEPTLPPPRPEPTSAVIGRYEADGTSYVMYADGSIEAHSETGVERFNSMAELKAYIESVG